MSPVPAFADDVLRLDSNFVLGAFEVQLGGSLQYEHRYTNNSFTGRLGIDIGGIVDGGSFTGGIALVGFRHYWNETYLDLEAGVFVWRKDRYVDDESNRIGVAWSEYPDLRATLGHQIGFVDLGIFADVPLVALGVQLGVRFARW